MDTPRCRESKKKKSLWESINIEMRNYAMKHINCTAIQNKIEELYIFDIFKIFNTTIRTMVVCLIVCYGRIHLHYIFL